MLNSRYKICLKARFVDNLEANDGFRKVRKLRHKAGKLNCEHAPCAIHTLNH